MFFKTPICVLSVLAFSAGVMGQDQFGWQPSVDLVEIPSLDFDALAAEDITREEAGMAPRYAIPNKVTQGPAYGGTWTQPDADTWLWELRVASPGIPFDQPCIRTLHHARGCRDDHQLA